MNLYFHHFRKKDFEPSKDSSKKKDSKKSKDKASKSTKNAYEQIELHQLALEHALAYFTKPWDYYLEKEKPSSKRKSKCVNNESRSRKEEEVNFNSYLPYQNYEDVESLKSDMIVEAKGDHYHNILSKNR